MKTDPSLQCALIVAALHTLCVSSFAQRSERQDLPVLLAKSVFTVDDILKLPTAGDLSISPQGDWIAYTLSAVDFEHNTTNVNITLTSTDARNPTTIQLTRGTSQNTHPQWSPSANVIAFLSNQNDLQTKQIYVTDRITNETVKLTECASGVSLFRFSPDGTQIAFLTKDSTDHDLLNTQNQHKDVIVLDHHLQMVHLWTVDISTKAPHRLTHGGFTVLDFSWSPDGSSLAYAAQPKPTHPPDYYEADLFVIDVKSGTSRRILSEPGKDISPLWSPDGRWIACVSNGGTFDWIGNEYILIVDPKTGESKNLTQHFDEIARIVAWSSDSKSLYFSAWQGIAAKLFVVSIENGNIHTITPDPDYYSSFSLTKDMRRIAMIKQNVKTPPEIYISPVRSFKPQRLTSIYTNLQNFKIASTEMISWKSTDGKYVIEGLLTKPLGFSSNKTYPFLVIAHGGPPSVFSNTFVLSRLTYPVQLFAQEGFLILHPNVRGSGGYGEKFRKANVSDWGGGDFEDLMAGVDYCITQGWADPDRLGIMGWSYGGYLTSITISKTQRFKAASVGAGITNPASYYGTCDIPDFVEAYFEAPPWKKPELYLERSAVFNAHRIVTPTLIQHGDRDDRVPISQSQELYVALKKVGVLTEFVIYPREWHILKDPKHQRDALIRNLRWFTKWVKGEEYGFGK